MNQQQRQIVPPRAIVQSVVWIVAASGALLLGIAFVFRKHLEF
jgi:hypothetical protein